jgi:FMN phosphatase YigB (HAD superfamily)
MGLKMILFDLDGTLLPMDQDEFVKAYFGLLAKKLSNYGYEPNKLINSIWKGTMVMINNDGSKTNEEAFWDFFKSVYGEESINDHDIFEEFYKNEFQLVQHVCGYIEKAGYVIRLLKQHGFKVALATNPIFPAIATESRIRWAGLKKEDFELITTYENSKYSKPNLNYYIDILDKLNVKPDECMMVGNDVAEDMVARKLGMKVFLMPKYLINKNNEDINSYPNGNFDELLIFIEDIKKSEQ